jgi:hypothetical protein
MKIGFTGTRTGMTEVQKRRLAEMFRTLRPLELHHGDCVGADDEAANISQTACELPPDIHCHPPINESNRAFNRWSKVTHERKTYLERNRRIIDRTDVLIAAAVSKPLPETGGTRYTVDYAQKRGRPVCVIWPDGIVEFLGIQL